MTTPAAPRALRAVRAPRAPGSPRARRRARRPAAVLLVALLGLGLLAGPAAAHPFFRGGGEVPVDSLATMTLDLAHGCGTEAAGDGEDTTEVALEVPDWMRIVEVPAPDGWSVDLETAADGTRVEVVTWTTADPVEPAPTFDLDVVVRGEAGDQRFVRVFQACGDVAYRWVGTPEEPADDPAVRLAFVAADPDRPAPPEPEAAADPQPGDDTTAADDPAGDDATDDGVDDGQPDDGPATDEDLDTTTAAEPTVAEEAPFPWVLVASIVLVLLAAGAWFAARNRGTASADD